ncbi:MAG: hypothetical protein JNL45_01190 [Hyphomicrobium sp.]|jgi:hypothetical protein|nr:hypothetical protein [Hyphomicrobium sp.]
MRKQSSSILPAQNQYSDPRTLVRRAELQRLLPMWPHELADLSLNGRRRILQFLARALREERRRCRAGHWTYDLARHAALARHMTWERGELEKLQRARSLAQPLKRPHVADPSENR